MRSRDSGDAGRSASTPSPSAAHYPVESFAGFPEGVGLLALVGEQTKEEFAAGRARWDETIRQPVEALIEDLGRLLRAQVSPTVEAVAKTNGSLSPITRDLRFAADKTHPYKDHLLLNFWDGVPKRNAPTLRLRISADTIGFAAGAAFDPPALARWRAAIAGSRGAEFVDVLQSLGTRHDLRFGEPELKRAPTGYQPDGTDRDRLIRCKSVQVRFIEPTPSCVSSGDFAHWAGTRLLELGGVHRWLRANTQ